MVAVLKDISQLLAYLLKSYQKCVESDSKQQQYLIFVCFFLLFLNELKYHYARNMRFLKTYIHDFEQPVQRNC